MKRIPREYRELRIDLSRDALAHGAQAIDEFLNGFVDSSREELENLRNQMTNMVQRFDEELCS